MSRSGLLDRVGPAGRLPRALVVVAAALWPLGATGAEAQACVGIEDSGRGAVLLHGGIMAGGPMLGSVGWLAGPGPVGFTGVVDATVGEGDYAARAGARLVWPEPYEVVSLCFIAGLDLYRVRQTREPSAYDPTWDPPDIRHGGISPSVGIALGDALDLGQVRLSMHSAAELQAPLVDEGSAWSWDVGVSFDAGLIAKIKRYLIGVQYTHRLESSPPLVHWYGWQGYESGKPDRRTVALRLGTVF